MYGQGTIGSTLIALTLGWKVLKQRWPNLDEDKHAHQGKQILDGTGSRPASTTMTQRRATAHEVTSRAQAVAHGKRERVRPGPGQQNPTTRGQSGFRHSASTVTISPRAHPSPSPNSLRAPTRLRRPPRRLRRPDQRHSPW
jgi:hypothetical protein